MVNKLSFLLKTSNACKRARAKVQKKFLNLIGCVVRTLEKARFDISTQRWTTNILLEILVLNRNAKKSISILSSIH